MTSGPQIAVGALIDTPTNTLRLLIVAWLISILLTVAGCSGGFDSESNRLNEAYEQWEARAVDYYRFAYVKSCYCEGNGERFEAIVCSGLERQGGLTIDDVFLAAKSAIAEGDRSLRLTVNPDFSYPEEIAFGSDLGADAGIAVSILSFSPLSAGVSDCSG